MLQCSAVTLKLEATTRGLPYPTYMQTRARNVACCASLNHRVVPHQPCCLVLMTNQAVGLRDIMQHRIFFNPTDDLYVDNVLQALINGMLSHSDIILSI